MNNYLYRLLSNVQTDDESSSQHNGIAGEAFVIVACTIFAIVSYTFLFPCNKIIPLGIVT